MTHKFEKDDGEGSGCDDYIIEFAISEEYDTDEEYDTADKSILRRFLITLPNDFKNKHKILSGVASWDGGNSHMDGVSAALMHKGKLSEAFYQLAQAFTNAGH